MVQVGLERVLEAGWAVTGPMAGAADDASEADAVAIESTKGAWPPSKAGGVPRPAPRPSPALEGGSASTQLLSVLGIRDRCSLSPERTNERKSGRRGQKSDVILLKLTDIDR